MTQKKNLKFQFGFNSFPPSVEKRVIAFINLVVLYINIGFFYGSFLFVFQLYAEKKFKIDVMLYGLGISKATNFLSWISIYFMINSFVFMISCIGLSIILKFNLFFIVSYLLLFMIDSFLISFIITTSFKGKNGINLFSILSTISLMISFFLIDKDIIPILKFILTIFPHINLSYSFQAIIKYQTLQEVPINIMTMNVGGISLLINMIILIIEIIILFLILIVSLKKKELGLSFINFIKYIFIKKRPNIFKENINKIDDNDNKSNANNIPVMHEELSDMNKSLKQENNCLKIKNIYKEYGDDRVVDNFYCELFKDEIFALLGHNGAGKTTLIKIISGAEDPTNGDILLNNESLISNRNLLHQNLGVCFQEDIFFYYLTINEHLKFMIDVKKNKFNQDQIDNILKDLELIGQKNQICFTLSGGQKRKLCIALALIGNSKIVLLDEPSSGLDVFSKRKLWEFLRSYKKDKIIILTTHSLEEAEYLGDRIGIMNTGKFICSGSSSYLKENYTHGFYLKLITNNKKFTEEVKKELYEKIEEYDPGLQVKISSKNEYSFILNYNNENINKIFNQIEENKQNYGIEDYSVSSSSLEEAFFKVNCNNFVLNENDNKINNNNEIIDFQNLDFKISMSFCAQIIIHLKRLFLGLWRQKTNQLLELLFCSFLFYVILLTKITIYAPKVTKNKFDLVSLLEHNQIFTNDIKYFQSLYMNTKKIKFKEIKQQETIEKFIEEIYKNAYLNIGKAGIQINKVNENKIIFYNTEIPMNKTSYIISNIMLSVSSFLKNEYGINALIFPEITYTNENDKDDNKFNSIYFGISVPIAYNLYICLAVSDIIQENKNGLKHLLYLSGINMFSYWVSLFIFHFFKLFFMNLIISLGIYFVSGTGIYIFSLLIFASFSSIFLYYSIIKYIEQDIILLIVLFISIILIAIFGFLIVLIFKINLYNLLMSPDYNFIDLLPMTSEMKGCYSFAISYYNTMSASNVRIIDIIIIQFINFTIYLVLMILNEKYIFQKVFNYIKVKLFINDSNTTFSNEKINEEFLNDNILLKIEKLPLLSNNIQNENINNDDVKGNKNTINSNLVDNERNRIIEDSNKNIIPIKIVGLKKTYWFCCKKNIRAVNKIYFGLEDNEKFGLLGFNGSGKTTTFKSITKEIVYDSGILNISNRNINSQFNEIRKTIGYCPQENPILDYMKVREMIEYYLDLKEIPDSAENV